MVYACRDSFFCFTRKGSYSGVATYCRTAVTTVCAAEEGLLRVLPLQNPVSAAAQHVAATAATAAAAVESAAVTPSAIQQQELVRHRGWDGGSSGRTDNCKSASSSGPGSALAAWPQSIVFPEAELRAM